MAERYGVPISFPCRIPEHTHIHTQAKCEYQDFRISADVRSLLPQFLAEATSHRLKTTADSISKNTTCLSWQNWMLFFHCELIISSHILSSFQCQLVSLSTAMFGELKGLSHSSGVALEMAMCVSQSVSPTLWSKVKYFCYSDLWSPEYNLNDFGVLLTCNLQVKIDHDWNEWLLSASPAPADISILTCMLLFAS